MSQLPETPDQLGDPQIAANGADEGGRGRWTSWRRPDLATLCFGVLIATGLVVRILLARTGYVRPTSDQATGMIMALRASQGHPTLMFLGQHYGGALLSWLEAPLIALFGFHLRLFWVVDTLVTLAGAVVLWLVARRFIPPIAAALCGGLFFFFSPRWLYYSGQENLFYVPGIVLSLLAAWLVLRWFDRHELWVAFGLGACAGLAMWCSAMTATLLLPPGAAFAWGARRRIVDLGGAAAGFVVGVSPWIAVIAMKGTVAFQTIGTKQGHTAAFKEAVTKLIPISLGLGNSSSAQATIGWIVLIGSAACVGLFVAQRRYALVCCSASVVLWPFVVVAARFPLVPSSYRYAFFMAAPLIVVVCFLVSLIRLSALVAVAMFVSVTHTTYGQTHRFAAIPVCDPTFGVIRSDLVSLRRTAVWGSYWAGAVLSVCQYPRLTVGIAAEKGDASWAHAAAAAPDSTYVVTGGAALDHEIGGWTYLHDRRAHRQVIGHYAVWLLPNSVAPTTMHLSGAY